MPTPIRSLSRRKSAVGAMAILMLLLAPMQAARAQSMDRPAPDPISTRMIARYAERLELGEEQLQAAQTIHEDYRRAFEEIEQKLIQPHIAERGGGGMMIRLDESAIRKDVESVRELMQAVERADNRFFDELQQLLTEDQSRRLPQVRQMRRREREMVGATMGAPFIAPAARVDLTRLVDEAAGGVAIDSEADVLLSAYERELTKRVNAMHEASVTCGLRVVERLDARGIQLTPSPDQSEKDMQTSIETFFSVMAEAQQDVHELAGSIAQLNRETVARLRDVLDEDAQLRLERAFIGRAYPGVLGRTGDVARRFDWALEQEALSKDQHQAVEQLRRSYIEQCRRVFDEAMDAADDARSISVLFNPTPEMQEAQRKARDNRDAIAEERDELIERASLALDALLGEDMTKRLAEAMEKEAEQRGATETRREVSIVAIATVEGDDDAGPPTIRAFGGTFELEKASGALRDRTLVPAPIGQEQLDAYISMMSLDDTERPVAETIHDQYVDGFDTMRRTALEQMREAQAAFERVSEQGAVRQPSEEEIRDRYERERQTMQRVSEHDARFFDDLALILDNDDDRSAGLERARLQRQRDLYAGRTPGPDRPGMFGGSDGFIVISGVNRGDEPGVDVSKLVEELALEVDQAAAAEQILLPYEREAAQLFKKRYEARRRAREERGVVMARMAEVEQEADGRSIAFGMDDFAEVERHQQVADQISLQLLKLNRATRDALVEALDVQSARQLERRYLLAAFPNAYRDSRSAEPAIDAALRLPGLSPAQQDELRALLGEYRAAHEAFGDQLAAIRAEAAQARLETGTGDGFIGLPDRQQESSRLEFERNELNDRTRLRLREILTDEQEGALGPLLEAASRE